VLNLRMADLENEKRYKGTGLARCSDNFLKNKRRWRLEVIREYYVNQGIISNKITKKTKKNGMFKYISIYVPEWWCSGLVDYTHCLMAKRRTCNCGSRKMLKPIRRKSRTTVECGTIKHGEWSRWLYTIW